MHPLRYFIGDITQPPETWSEVDVDTYTKTQQEASLSRFYRAGDDSHCSYFRDGFSDIGFAMKDGRTPWEWEGTMGSIMRDVATAATLDTAEIRSPDYTLRNTGEKVIRRIFGDFEFLPADPHLSGMISIGLTDEDNKDYYAVNADMDLAAVFRHDWIMENVWPHLPLRADRTLDFRHPDVKSSDQIREEVALYFGEGEEPPHFFAHYGAQDMCRLHSLWDNDWMRMPVQIPRWFFDIRALRAQQGNIELPMQDSAEHHALADAQYNRTAFQFLQFTLQTGNS